MRTFVVLLMVMLFVVFNPFREEHKEYVIEDASPEDYRQSEYSQDEKDDKIHKVHVTVYHAVPEQCNEDPGHTSTMFKLDLENPYKHRIIALSRDLLKKFPYHSKVRLEGTKYDGVYVVEDTMNKRYKNRADVLINQGMKLMSVKNAKIIAVD